MQSGTVKIIYIKWHVVCSGLATPGVDSQVEHLPTSSRKQPAFHASHVLEVPGPSLFCMGGILSPDVKFPAHYGQIPPRRVHV